MDINLKEKLAILCENSYTTNNYTQFKNDSGVQVFMVKDSNLKHLYVIFRGSDELVDWSFSLNFLSKTISSTSNNENICVHHGYDNMIKGNTLLNTLLDRVEVIQKTLNYTIYVSGHSLGGCLSQLFSFYLQKQRNVKSSVVMFGSPYSIGNRVFQEFLDNKNIHCVNYIFETDPVPKLLCYIYPNVHTKNILIPNLERRFFLMSHSINYYRSMLEYLL